MSLRPRARVVSGALGAAALSLGLASCGSGGLASSGTFTFSWTTTPTPTATTAGALARLKPIPFSGTIAGIPVRGSAENPAGLVEPLLNGGVRQIPASFVIARWTGTLDSKPFHVSVSAQGFNASSPNQVAYAATGAYGAQPIRVIVDVGAGTGASTVRFTGTFGSRRLRGSLTIPNAGGTTGTAHGTFTLTG